MLKEEYKNLKILYVEDEELIRSNAVSYLQRLFHNIYEASNASEAINIIKEHSPHIVISDIKMPKMNGLDMIREIREYDKQTKRIIEYANGAKPVEQETKTVVKESPVTTLKPFTFEA